MKFHWVLRTSLLLLVLASCAPSQTVNQPSASSVADIPTQEKQTQEVSSPMPFEVTPEIAGTLSPSVPAEKFVVLAKKDLAGRLALDIDQIVLIEATEIIWPDAALGCPRPGKVYAQGRVPGYRIGLEAQGIEHIYHADQTGQVILCVEQNPDEGDPLFSLIPDSNQDDQIGVPIK